MSEARGADPGLEDGHAGKTNAEKKQTLRAIKEWNAGLGQSGRRDPWIKRKRVMTTRDSWEVELLKSGTIQPCDRRCCQDPSTRCNSYDGGQRIRTGAGTGDYNRNRMIAVPEV